MSNLVLVDLDGTLADGTHRLHHIQKAPRDWDSFYDECGGDSPHEDVIGVVNSINEQYTTIILTGRVERTRAVTEEWLSENEVGYHALIMRPEGCRTDDHIWKIEVARMFGLHNIAFVIEDRNRVVEAFRKVGVRVMHIADGNF